jgi:hypothetical protein
VLHLVLLLNAVVVSKAITKLRATSVTHGLPRDGQGSGYVSFHLKIKTQKIKLKN